MVKLRIAALAMVLASAVNVPTAFASGNELYDDTPSNQQQTISHTSRVRHSTGTPAVVLPWWDDLGGRN